MNLLIDTDVVLWWLADDPALPDGARAVIASPEHRAFVSAASAWEIAIWRELGELTAPADLRSALLASGFEELAITLEHAGVADGLPLHHDEPFDRMLVAQARVEELTLVTVEPVFEAYGIDLLLFA